MSFNDLHFNSRNELDSLIFDEQIDRSLRTEILNAYLKAYVSGIIDNYDFIVSFVSKNDNNIILKNDLIDSLYVLKSRIYNEWRKYII